VTGVRNRPLVKRLLDKPSLCLLLFSLLAAKPCLAGGPRPIITVQPLSQTVLIGGTVTFRVVASSGTTLTYQWLKNGSKIPGATLSAYTIVQAKKTDQGGYSVKVTNAGGSVTSSIATLTVLVPPLITTQPQNQTVAVGQNAFFSVVATGTAPLSYQWSLNGTALSAATTSALKLKKVQATDAGSYTVVVTNVAGSITSSGASLTITNPAITLFIAGGEGMTSNGFTFQFLVPVGLTYVILASTNNQDWTAIATNVALTASVVFTDTLAAGYSSRFYRATVR
jgi:hypothetical protein